MAHGSPDFQPVSMPTMPNFGEGQVTWFQSEVAEVTAGEEYDLITYVVPDNMELHVCSGIVSCEAPRTQRFNVITTPAGDWISPTSHIDPDSKWYNKENAYDGKTGTYAGTIEETGHYLQLLLATPTTCNKVRIDASTFPYGGPFSQDPDIDIDVYYEGAWHNIHSGTVTKHTWVEVAIGATKLVSQARIKWNTFLEYGLAIWEFMFDATEETPQETIYFDTYAVIPFVPQAPYPVPAGATFTLRVYNDDAAAQKFSVNLAGFLQAKV